MCSAEGCQDFSWRVRPFGDPRVEGCVPLTADYRSLPRPSSAPCAKASAVRPRYLPAPSGRDAVSRHLNVWVSHTLGGSRHRRSSCNLLYLQIGRYISYLNIEESIRSLIDPSCRYAALKVRGVTPGTGHAKGRSRMETRAHLRRNFVRFGSLVLSESGLAP